jgi:hypothetical protein
VLTDYDSFGTSARVVGIWPTPGGAQHDTSIPVRTVFLAHGDELQCFENGKIHVRTCCLHSTTLIQCASSSSG